MFYYLYLQHKFISNGGIKMKNNNNRNENLVWGGVQDYRKEISKRISDIKELWILKEILKFIINMTKEGN